MKKYYATQLESKMSDLDNNFENLLKKEEFLVYIGHGADAEIKIKKGSVFVGDIGRGGGGITEWGEIYSAMKYMATLCVQGVLYDLLKNILFLQLLFLGKANA